MWSWRGSQCILQLGFGILKYIHGIVRTNKLLEKGKNLHLKGATSHISISTTHGTKLAYLFSFSTICRKYKQRHLNCDYVCLALLLQCGKPFLCISCRLESRILSAWGLVQSVFRSTLLAVKCLAQQVLLNRFDAWRTWLSQELQMYWYLMFNIRSLVFCFTPTTVDFLQKSVYTSTTCTLWFHL